MTEETREALEDRVFDLPLMREQYPSASERDVLVRNMSDDELRETLTVSQSELVESKPAPVAAPDLVRTRNSEKRIKRVKRVKTVKTGETFVEKDGQLYRRENWAVIDSRGTIHRDWHDYLCGQRVRWEGRLVSASIVLHWLRTGEHVKRVPSSGAKTYRAVVWHEGKTKHLGYFATADERDAAIFSFKLGLTP